MIHTPGWWAVQLAFCAAELRWMLEFEWQLLLEARQKRSRLLEAIR